MGFDRNRLRPAMSPVIGAARGSRAFSLLEVVAAVTIFAISMVAVLGLYTPVAQSVSNANEAEAAARVTDALLSRLQSLPFEALTPLLKTNAELQAQDARGNYNPNDGSDRRVIFATLGGEAGIYDTARRGWVDSTGRLMPDREKFFEIALVRNETVSPADQDELAAFVAFNCRVRWPVFRPNAAGGGVQVGANQTTQDHSRKQVLFFSGAVTRTTHEVPRAP
jgi:prepilin-type N-terminal cleavage/methylation domain-containing protein